MAHLNCILWNKIGTLRLTNSLKLKNKGYYTKGDEKMESKYNHSAEGKFSLSNNIIPYFGHMPVIHHILSSDRMPGSGKKSLPLPVYYRNSFQVSYA